jgi:4-hydroxythreonine-4-phosphate dehydrogenase
LIRLAVSIGCPCGIGPEVSLVAAASLRGARVLLVGDRGALAAAARVRRIDASRIVVVERPEDAWRLPPRAIAVFEPLAPLAVRDRKPGAPARASGAAQLGWIDVATDLVAHDAADALVTGPVSKDAIARSGAPGSRGFLGHTEHLARRLRAPEVTMAFYAREKSLTTSLVTTHLPLARVPRAITKKEVARAAFWTADFVARVQNTRKRSVVCIAALNPHAGEHGLLGDEERTAIAPGIALAQRRLARSRLRVDLVGPVPAESAFRHASRGAYAAVVAMYHDQATIPMKLLGFGDAVNVSLGLPIVRTSVDHGTAYDRAYRGTADARGMIEAMRLAVKLGQ